MATKAIQTNLIATEEVEHILRGHLAAFARGDFDAWGSAFAPAVFFTAADPEEVFSTREDAVAEMHKDFDPAFEEGLQIEVEPLSFQVGLTSDGKAAWTVAPLRYWISFQGETSSFVLRHTSVLIKSRLGWSIRATQYSLALLQEKVLQALTTGRLPAPQFVGDVVMAEAQELVAIFKYQLADFSRTSIGTDAQIFGPFPGEQAEGETAVRELFASWTSKWGALRLRPDGVCAGLVSNEMGWVGANVDAQLPYGDRQADLPLRILVVYQKEQENWGIAHAHVSVGIPDELAE